MQSQEGFTVMKVLTIDYLNSSFFVTHPSNIYRKEKLLLFLPGQTCPDPLSCPFCAGVFCDPITLPCGHSYCRKCIAKTPALKTSCLKCGSHWRPADCLESSDAGTDEKDVISHLKPNVLVSLFQKSQPQKLFMTVLVYCS